MTVSHTPIRRLAWGGAIALILAGSAWAHPRVEARSPEAGAKLKASPTAVRITFSEAVDANLSGPKIVGPSQQAVPLGKPTTENDYKTLVIPIQGKLRPGAYTVTWQTVTEDHEVPGRYRFEITR